MFKPFLCMTALWSLSLMSNEFTVSDPPDYLQFECENATAPSSAPTITLEGEKHHSNAALEMRAANLLRASRGEIFYIYEGVPVLDPSEVGARSTDDLEIAGNSKGVSADVYPLEADGMMHKLYQEALYLYRLFDEKKELIPSFPLGRSTEQSQSYYGMASHLAQMMSLKSDYSFELPLEQSPLGAPNEGEFRRTMQRLRSDPESKTKLQNDLKNIAMALSRLLAVGGLNEQTLPIEHLPLATSVALGLGVDRATKDLIDLSDSWREYYMAKSIVRLYCLAADKGVPIVANMGNLHLPKVSVYVSQWLAHNFPAAEVDEKNIHQLGAFYYRSQAKLYLKESEGDKPTKSH